MAEAHLEQIKILRTRIDEYLGIRLVRESEDITLRLVSESYRAGVAPIHVITRTLSAIQKGWQRVGEYVARSKFDLNASISQGAAAKNFDLNVVAFSPGSFQIGLNAVPVKMTELSPETTNTAIHTFVRVLEYASSISTSREKFRQEIPDSAFQLEVLQAMKDVAPPRRGADYFIEFGGRILGPTRFVFGPETRDDIVSVIRSTQQHVTQTGLMRRLNLDNRTFVINTETMAVTCQYPANLQELVKEGLDRWVKVEGHAFMQIDGTIRTIKIRTIQPASKPTPLVD
jgi:hypothetical protein